MKETTVFSKVVIVSALGYFVDIFDLILFGIVRQPSLQSLQVVGEQSKQIGDFLLNCQMFGMLTGGLLWGILGDSKGRLKVLFGSIILYSLANIANAGVGFLPIEWGISAYALLRFVAGVGLAGEFGAGITLVNELMDKEKRGWGATIIATVGALGAVFAGFIGKMFSWETAYFIGGVLGLLLLFLRVGTLESGMFEKIKDRKGVFVKNLKILFLQPKNVFRYLACIVLSMPIWSTISILILLSPELTQQFGIQGKISISNAIAYCYLGLSFGDLLSGAISQWIRSRKKAVLLFLAVAFLTTIAYCNSFGITVSTFYIFCFLLGTTNGFWVIANTWASEQFGTDVRSTVSITVPNFVRGAVVPITLGFRYFEQVFHSGLTAALIVCILCILLSLIGVLYLKDTFGKDLDYVEADVC